MGLTRSIKDLTYEDLNKEIKRTMRRSAKDVVQIGFMLRRMMEEKLWENTYSCFDDYLSQELHMDYSMANRFVNINRRYSLYGNSMEIADKYEDYSQGLLIEMLNMPPELEVHVTPDMTVKQVREIKKQAKPKREKVQEPEKKEVIIDGEYREIKEPEPEKESIATSQSSFNEKAHDEAWFVEQYAVIMPQESAKLIDVCQKEKCNSDMAKAVQNFIAPYGCHSCGCSEYDFDFHGFAGGIDFRIGNEKIHLKYGRFVKELMKIKNLTEKTEDLPNAEESVEIDELSRVKRILSEKKHDLEEWMKVAAVEKIPEDVIFEKKTIVGALAAMVFELDNIHNSEPEPDLQPELPVLKNNDQRKEWLAKYKDWGLWYRDENIDVNYYKYDFTDGSRLVVTEYPKRHSYWSDELKDECYYHLLEKNKKGYKRNYDETYRHREDCETYLVDFLKNLQKKK